MAIAYRIAERKVNKKDKETGKYVLTPIRVAVQASKGRIPVEDVARRIEKETALGFGDVLSVLASLGPVVAEYASLGYSVDLDRSDTSFKQADTSRTETKTEDKSGRYIVAIVIGAIAILLYFAGKRLDKYL